MFNQLGNQGLKCEKLVYATFGIQLLSIATATSIFSPMTPLSNAE